MLTEPFGGLVVYCGDRRHAMTVATDANKCRELVLPYVTEHYHAEKLLCVVSFNILTFFQTETVQIGQLLLITFHINRFPGF